MMRPHPRDFLAAVEHVIEIVTPKRTPACELKLFFLADRKDNLVLLSGEGPGADR
jgi:hypothetical protein